MEINDSMKGGKSNHNRLLHNDMRPTNHIEQTDNRQSMDRGEEDGGQNI